MKKICKILLVIYRELIKLISYINVNLYMKLYVFYLKKIGVKIKGMPKFIANSVYFDGIDYSLISINDSVVISKDVMILTHDYSIARGLQSICGKKNDNRDEYYLRKIVIGENCFIGARASILPGTIIGDNVIIGACAVVKGNIPDNSIVVGNPYKIIEDTKDWGKRKQAKNDYYTEM